MKNYSIILTTVTTLFLASCSSSTPKKDQHALADILLKKRPRIGVPVASHPESMENPQNAALLMKLENDQERARNQEIDQAGFENKIREFRGQFMELMTEKNKILTEYTDNIRVRELQRLSDEADQLMEKLTQYAQQPGTLDYYLEGQEREFVFRQRSERLKKLESNWRENLAHLQGELSEARTTAAIEALGSSPDVGLRSSGLSHEY